MPIWAALLQKFRSSEGLLSLRRRQVLVVPPLLALIAKTIASFSGHHEVFQKSKNITDYRLIICRSAAYSKNYPKQSKHSLKN